MPFLDLCSWPRSCPESCPGIKREKWSGSRCQSLEEPLLKIFTRLWVIFIERYWAVAHASEIILNWQVLKHSQLEINFDKYEMLFIAR